MAKALAYLLATTTLSLASPVLAQVDPGQTAPTQPGTAPAVSPTAPGRTGVDQSSTDVTRAATGDKAPDNANAPSDGIGEIVVTAQRVESSAQKTPVALTVYTGADLAARGVTSIQNLGTLDPSVNVTTNGGGNYVAVRGIASTDVTEIGDPSVPIARDGFFTNRSFSIATSIYDLQRVEILKGPQGTLFGRNSTGGLINIITRRPGDDLGANGSLELGNYRTVDAELGVDLPIDDKVQLRLAGIARRHDGYRHLEVVGGRGDDDNTVSGRATLVLKPIDGLDAVVSYQHDEVDNVGDVFLTTEVGNRPASGYDEKHFPNYAPTFYRLNGDRIRWEATYDRLPGGLSLIYSGGYDVQHWRHALDASGANGVSASNFRQNENPVTWNHEVRIATPQDGRFSLQAGFFHFDETNNLDSGLTPLAAGGDYLIHFQYRVKTKSNGLFGQVGFRPTDTIRLSAGARYTWDSKNRTGTGALRCDLAGIPSFLYGVLGCDGTPPVLITPGNGAIKEHKPTFHAGIDWNPTNRNLVYAKFDTGFKSGGFNSNGSAPSINYAPETVQTFEVGSKNKFADGHLQLNADAFYTKYKGYQASQSTAVISGSASGIFNVGSANIYGAEAQLIAKWGGLRADLNATYLHAQFSDSVGSIVRGDSAATPVDIGGNRLPNAPRFALSGGIEYAIDAGSVRLTPRIDGKYSSAFYYSAFNDPDTQQKRYATGNLSLAIEPTGSPLQFQLFVRNFTDAKVFALAYRQYVTTPATNAFEFQPPRTYGVRASFNF